MDQKTTQTANANGAPADVFPGPKRFCLAPIKRTLNTRWTFSVRYYDENKRRTITDDYSAETRVEIEERLTAVAQRIRGQGYIMCDCGCEFMSSQIAE